MNFERNFIYGCKYEDLSKRFFELRLHEVKKDRTEVKAIYRVDLYTLSIGPIHHSIELTQKVYHS
jgi:hypothetical protein